MPIAYSPARWDKVKESHRRWWAGKLERPLIAVRLRGRNPGSPQPATPLLSQATCSDLEISPDDLINRIDYELSCYEFLGDAFPMVNLDSFGPGVAAAFLGAQLDNNSGRVWFHPPRETPITELHFSYDPNNKWLSRVLEICAAAMRRWQGQVLVGMVDLGGVLDILSTFLPGEKLIYELYDHPEEVKRLVWELHNLWHRYYEDINAVLQPMNPGYSDWSAIYSDQPSYILQSDFSYMVSPTIFAELIRPELVASCRRLSRSFYHLDGIGQIPHLDLISSISELGGIQWVPGDGSPLNRDWSDLYRSIHASGKLLQVIPGTMDRLTKVTGWVGTARGIHMSTGGRIEQHEWWLHHLASYDVEA